MSEQDPKANGWALVPFLVFAVFYVGLSFYAGRCGMEMPWYKVPMPIAFLVASAVAVALKSGRVEFVIADIDPAKNCVKGEADLQLSDFITSEEYAVAIRKGQPELLATINATITELKENGSIAKWIAEYTAESDKLKEK